MVGGRLGGRGGEADDDDCQRSEIRSKDINENAVLIGRYKTCTPFQCKHISEATKQTCKRKKKTKKKKKKKKRKKDKKR